MKLFFTDIRHEHRDESCLPSELGHLALGDKSAGGGKEELGETSTICSEEELMETSSARIPDLEDASLQDENDIITASSSPSFPKVQPKKRHWATTGVTEKSYARPRKRQPQPAGIDRSKSLVLFNNLFL